MGAEARPAWAAEVLPRPSRLSHPTATITLSSLLPGLGQMAAGHRIRGLVVMAPLMLVVAGGLWLGIKSDSDLVGLALDPAFLWVLVAANLVVLGWRLFAVFDAYLVARNGRSVRPGSFTAGWLSLFVLLTAAPHLVIGSAALASIDVIVSVFQPPVAEQPEVPTLPATVLSTTQTSVPPISTVPPTSIPGLFTAGLVPIPAIPESSPPPEARSGTPLPDRITILLAGADAGPGRNGFRTDAIMVASLDTRTGRALLFGIPRNMGYAPLPQWLEDQWDSECKCFPEPINHLYVRTSTWTEVYPEEVDPGMAALRDVLSNLLALPIDHYVRVDMRGFVRLVDALGGVTVDVRASIHDRVSPVREDEEWIEIDIKPGRNSLNGREALAYVRSRYGSSDYNRMARQRCVLSALAARAEPLRVLANFGRLAEAVKLSTVTDITYDELPQLARLAALLDAEDIATVGFVPDAYASSWGSTGLWVPDAEEMRQTVSAMLGGEYSAPHVTSGGESECGR